ncbi:MAG: hypothetical protein M3R02_27225 [Chloroflexota bacterium]|nr:hypothetical protein [Chloroflexota bacterium]
MSDTTDELFRAYSTLTALHSRLPERYIEERWAVEYNTALARVGNNIGRDLSEFAVPDDYFYREVSSYNQGTGETRYRGEGRMVKADLFRARFDAALNYLKLLMPEEAVRKIGF